MMSSVKINYAAVGITLVVVLIITVKVFYVSSVQSEKASLKEILSVSIDLAQRGGEQTVLVKKEHKLNAESKGKTKEGKAEMKTDGDMRSHRTILSGFHNAFPQLSARVGDLLRLTIVSEEHDKKPEVGDYKPDKHLSDVANLADEMVAINDITIWVDPLDATQEYTEDLDEYVTVMICVAVKGKPIIGVIHRPQDSSLYKKETVWAWVGKGKSDNMKPVGDGPVPAAPNVIISRSHAGKAEEEVHKAFGAGKVTGAGGAGFKTIEVIRGKADVYAHVTLIKKWDICAGEALLNAVGGQMKTLKNTAIDYSKEGNPANTDGLLASMHHFDHYMNKLGPVFTAANEKH